MCPERPTCCSFACCDVTFPLSLRVHEAPAPFASARLLLNALTLSQGKHNADAVVAHAHLLLQQYLRRQILLAEINENLATLYASLDQKFTHVGAANAALMDEVAKVLGTALDPTASASYELVCVFSFDDYQHQAQYGKSNIEELINWWKHYSGQVGSVACCCRDVAVCIIVCR